MSKTFLDKNKTPCYECFDQTGIRRKCRKCHRYYHQKCLKSDKDRRKAMEIEKEKIGIRTKSYFDEKTDEKINYELCYACTLLEHGQNRNRPKMSKGEINYLLNFVLKRIVVWSSDLTKSYFEHVEQKIRRKKYSVLEEFLVDILDICYQIATENGSK